MREKLYTPEQVAKELQIHHLTVLKYIKEKRIKSIKLGRIYRVRESDLDIFINKSYLN